MALFDTDKLSKYMGQIEEMSKWLGDEARRTYVTLKYERDDYGEIIHKQLINTNSELLCFLERLKVIKFMFDRENLYSGDVVKKEDDERMEPVRLGKDEIIGYDWCPVLRRDKYIAGNLSFIKESVGEMMELNRHWYGRFALYARGYKDENGEEK